jgi:hypothetical protein
MTIIYRDCFNNVQSITKTIDDWGPNYEICSNSPDITISGGVITSGIQCGLTYKQCTEYYLDLTGIPPLDPVTVNYIDCKGATVSIINSAGTIDRSFCAERDSITASVGTLEIVQTCSGGTPPVIL